MDKMYPILRNTPQDNISQFYEIPFTLSEPVRGNASMSEIYHRMTKVLYNRGYVLIDIRWGINVVLVRKKHS